MIVINHTLSGYVCARVAMPLVERYAAISRRGLAWAMALGATMPDADILTKLIFGRGLYFSDLWYGHRGASHSVLGTLVMALVAAALLYGVLGRDGKRPGIPAYLWLAGGFWCGGLVHLLGDLFTPGWALPLLWPAADRVGGFRHIGWFTPYLLWLFVTTLALGWGLEALARLRADFRRYHGLCAWGLYTLATWRWVHFMVTSRYESRAQWMDLQYELLPEAMIVPITKGVSAVWHWLTG